MATISFRVSILLATLLLNLCLPHEVEAQPGPFINNRLRNAFNVIQRFKRRIQSDPKNFTGSWVGSNVCRYQGFVCRFVPDVKQLGVVGIDFNGALFGGFNKVLPLTGFLEQLPDLIFFHANSNNFTGTVPRGTSTLRLFKELDLSNNKLTGNYPNETVNAKNWSFLDLRYNSFSATLPSQAFNLPVDVLFLNNNNFRRGIPASLGSSQARYLTFANNKFTGSIPRTIRNARKTLTEVLFLGNTLTGCLPYEIGYLNQATVFDVSRNLHWGPIPNSFACLRKMQYLNLAGNHLYGTVPELVCQLPNLERLNLAFNFFTQVGPACRRLIRRKILDVRGNCILGQPLQKTSARCAYFFSKPRTCRRQSTFSLIPCRRALSGNLNETKSDINQEQVQAPAPLSYGTLAPHGH